MSEIKNKTHYDKSRADRAVAFISMLKHTKGVWHGKPFVLLPWQEKIVRDIFGTVKENGYRQYNYAYVEIPKKQGKSELAAAIALYLMAGDGEWGAEVYGCAADRQQASIVFDVAADMVEQCPALKARIKPQLSQKRLIYTPLNSFYQVLSAESYTKHGLNVHGVVFDELHAQPNRQLYDVMLHGSGDARKQPLFFQITTAGTDRNSICWEVHQKAVDILEGRKIDPTFYPVIYGIEDNADWGDENNWYKANPSLDVTVDVEKLRAAYQSAKDNPAEENLFRQLRLNQWVKHVKELWYLKPNLMTVERDSNTKKIKYTYIDDVTNETYVYRQEQIFHILGLGYDGIKGLSPIDQAREAVGLAIATEEYGARFFGNGARPGGILEHPGVLKDPEKLRESWNKVYQGARNSNKIAVLEEGMKYHEIGMSPEQSQFLQTRKYQLNEICRIFRVPPHLREDDQGLLVRIIPPDTSWARDLKTSIERGDITQMSFGFLVEEDNWYTENSMDVRELVRVKLFDVSPVTFPAYTATDVGIRGMERYEEIRNIKRLAENKETEEKELAKEKQRVKFLKTKLKNIY